MTEETAAATTQPIGRSTPVQLGLILLLGTTIFGALYGFMEAKAQARIDATEARYQAQLAQLQSSAKIAADIAEIRRDIGEIRVEQSRAAADLEKRAADRIYRTEWIHWRDLFETLNPEVQVPKFPSRN
ncbi:hypothetical protein [Engelhardtia mirabilis]|uniref:Uncharacterized protein n=1 Tax=Engelhardtia mirabilis TaxID=2528011 RepID=A0A518BL54_9BACT|nr:hypothetical protein Pla133_27710 [Planctomycetes bacterium Pla133]QDV02009.1 hypothetical protein Pla86_27700 [Planctomycetes bacterium Pla86]